MSGGTFVNNGASVSPTITLCSRVLTLPQASVAVHVLIVSKLPAHAPFIVFSAYWINTSGSQLSVTKTSGGVKSRPSSHCEISSIGTPVMTGAWSSNTLILWDTSDWFPQSSVADHIRIIVNAFGQSPAIISSEKSTLIFGLHSSVTVTFALFGIASSQDNVKSCGAWDKTGAVSSPVTVITCSATTKFPHLSVACHVLVNTNDDVQSTNGEEKSSVNWMFTFGSQLSVAKTVGIAGAACPQSNTRSSGTLLSTGSVLSDTTISCVPIVEFPQSSTASHSRCIV